MSAKRFGGAHSPGGPPRGTVGTGAAKRKGAKAPWSYSGRTRGWLMYVLPTPLLFAALSALLDAAPIRMAMLLVAWASLIFGAWLVNEGLRAADAYHEREVAKAPPIPRKILAALFAGVGVTLASWLGTSSEGVLGLGADLVTAVLFGVLTVVAHLFAFGLDPLKSKGVGTADGVAAAELDRVNAVLAKAEARLATIEELAAGLRDREITERVKALNATVREMIAIVERDPRDMSRARRYLGVYLTGAEEATRKYAENRAHHEIAKLREEYLALLDDLAASFRRGKEALLIDDRMDLEVEIEVLRERLGQEGA